MPNAISFYPLATEATAWQAQVSFLVSFALFVRTARARPQNFSLHPKKTGAFCAKATAIVTSKAFC